jgi:hypothetical protein
MFQIIFDLKSFADAAERFGSAANQIWQYLTANSSPR